MKPRIRLFTSKGYTLVWRYDLQIDDAIRTFFPSCPIKGDSISFTATDCISVFIQAIYNPQNEQKEIKS